MSTLKQIKSSSRIISGEKPVEVVEIGKPGCPSKLSVYNGQIYIYNQQGQTLIDGGYVAARAITTGSITAEKVSLSSKKYVHNITFTATDANTASWSSGTIKFADGASVSINSGNTGDITETHYIYFNNTNTLQKTTNYQTAVSSNNIPLAIVTPVTTGKCIIKPFRSVGETINGNLITTGKIQSTDQKTYFDLNENRIIMNDGTTNRVVIGKVGSNYVMRVSLPTYEATTDTNPDHYALYSDENWILIKEKTRNSVSISNGSYQDITHGLSYIPYVVVFAEVSSGVWSMVLGDSSDYDAHIELNTTNLRIYNNLGSTKTFKYYIFYDQQV